MKTYLKKFSFTLIAFSILILLAGYLYFFELKKPSEEESKKEIFTDIKEEQVDDVELKYSEHTIACKKEEGNWHVLKDSNRFKADGNVISTLIDNLSKIRIEKIVSENLKDLAGFGLENPKAHVVAKTPTNEYGISIGADSPVGSGTYIQVDDENEVLIVNKNSVMAFLDKSANDLRDKQILALDESKIKKLKFQWKDSVFEVGRTDGDWVGKDVPEYVEIDQPRVWAILKTFLNLKIDNFEEDEPTDLSAYGLDKPNAEIEIFEDEKPVRVLFGNKKEEGIYYVKLASEDSVYSISEFVYRQVPENVNDIRVRGIAKLDTEKVSGLEIKREDTAISIVREGNNWKLSGDKDKKVDEAKVYELISEIASLQVEKFVDDNPSDLALYGLDKPEIQLTISEGDERTILLFGKKEDKEVYAKLDDGKSVYLVNEEILSEIPSSLDELIKK